MVIYLGSIAELLVYRHGVLLTIVTQGNATGMYFRCDDKPAEVGEIQVYQLFPDSFFAHAATFSSVKSFSSTNPILSVAGVQIHFLSLAWYR